MIKLSLAPQCVDPSLVNLEPRTMTTTEPPRTIDRRSLAFLKAVADGRGEITISSEPDLFIDHLSCGDQFTAHRLAHEGLIAPSHPGFLGEHVPALLTSAGITALARV